MVEVEGKDRDLLELEAVPDAYSGRLEKVHKERRVVRRSAIKNQLCQVAVRKEAWLCPIANSGVSRIKSHANCRTRCC